LSTKKRMKHRLIATYTWSQICFWISSLTQSCFFECVEPCTNFDETKNVIINACDKQFVSVPTTNQQAYDIYDTKKSFIIFKQRSFTNRWAQKRFCVDYKTSFEAKPQKQKKSHTNASQKRDCRDFFL